MIEAESTDSDLAAKRSRGIEEYKKMVYEDLQTSNAEQEIQRGRWRVLSAMCRALQLSDEEVRIYGKAMRYEVEIACVKQRREQLRRQFEIEDIINGTKYTDQEIENRLDGYHPYPKPQKPQEGDKP